MSEVYIVLAEWGEYDDYGMCVYGVFATEEAARAYIGRQTATLCRTAGDELVETYMEDFEDVVETRAFAPTEHPVTPSMLKDGQVGGEWYIDGLNMKEKLKHIDMKIEKANKDGAN